MLNSWTSVHYFIQFILRVWERENSFIIYKMVILTSFKDITNVSRAFVKKIEVKIIDEFNETKINFKVSM